MSGCAAVIFFGVPPKSYIAASRWLCPPFRQVMFFALRAKSICGGGAARLPPQLYFSACRRSYITASRRLYPRQSRGLCFLPFGQKMNVCRGSRHIFIGGMHSINASLTVTAAALHHQNVPARRAHLNILSPKGDKIFHTREARISPRRRRDFTRRCASRRRISLLRCCQAAQQ